MMQCAAVAKSISKSKSIKIYIKNSLGPKINLTFVFIWQ